MTKIEYFKDGLSLGVFNVRDGSSSIDRYVLALEHKIGDFDMFILDGGRAGSKRIDLSEDLPEQYSYLETTNGIQQRWRLMTKQECQEFMHGPVKEIVSRYVDDPLEAGQMVSELDELQRKRLFAYRM